MPRATNAPATRARRKRKLKQAKGYFGNKSRLYRYAKDAVSRSGKFAYRDRRKKKSEFRQLWIVRINAACRPLDISYSRLMEGLKAAEIGLDRKAISEMAIHDEAAFVSLVEKAKAALADKASKAE
ncbi:50S ribosomal protein L20 [Cerasicoccus frondis]|uniref:50S ribosomal protein L20 n=1 Tax=Cerasicoccus frondis TaxID=490090 RepID=UPI002852A43B|nr:50S ribosomal protein L20 [Cerasicoccus frondis]